MRADFETCQILSAPLPPYTWPRHQKGRFHAFDTRLFRLEGWKGSTREVHGWLPPSQPRHLARAATWSARLFRALVEGRFAYLTHVLGGMALDRPPRPPRVRTLLGTTPAWVAHVVGGWLEPVAQKEAAVMMGLRWPTPGLVRALVLYNAIKNLIRIGNFFSSPPCDPSTRWRPSPAPWRWISGPE